MFSAGGAWADLNTTEQGLLDKLINTTHSQNHRLVRNARRWAEDDVTLTWVAGDDSIALPASIGEIVGRHIWIVDSTNNQPLNMVELLREEDFNDGFLPQPGSTQDPITKWDGSDTPVARIYREETSTRKRVLWVYPRPDAGTLFKILYLSEASLLSSASDMLEAPTAYNYVIALGAAIAWLTARGSIEKVSLLKAEKRERESELVGARETDRPHRVRFFDEIGYPGMKQGEPAVDLFPPRP